MYVCAVCMCKGQRGLGVSSVTVGLFPPRPVLSQLPWKLLSPGDLSVSASLEAGVTALMGKPVCYLGLESESCPHGFREVLLTIEPPLSSPCQGFVFGLLTARM